MQQQCQAIDDLIGDVDDLELKAVLRPKSHQISHQMDSFPFRQFSGMLVTSKRGPAPLIQSMNVNPAHSFLEMLEHTCRQIQFNSITHQTLRFFFSILIRRFSEILESFFQLQRILLWILSYTLIKFQRELNLDQLNHFDYFLDLLVLSLPVRRKFWF